MECYKPLQLQHITVCYYRQLKILDMLCNGEMKLCSKNLFEKFVRILTWISSMLDGFFCTAEASERLDERVSETSGLSDNDSFPALHRPRQRHRLPLHHPHLPRLLLPLRLLHPRPDLNFFFLDCPPATPSPCRRSRSSRTRLRRRKCRRLHQRQVQHDIVNQGPLTRPSCLSCVGIWTSLIVKIVWFHVRPNIILWPTCPKNVDHYKSGKKWPKYNHLAMFTKLSIKCFLWF